MDSSCPKKLIYGFKILLFSLNNLENSTQTVESVVLNKRVCLNIYFFVSLMETV